MPKALFGNSWAVLRVEARRRRKTVLWISGKRPFSLGPHTFFTSKSFFSRGPVSMVKVG
jgi:hypothetical protein